MMKFQTVSFLLILSLLSGCASTSFQKRKYTKGTFRNTCKNYGAQKENAKDEDLALFDQEQIVSDTKKEGQLEPVVAEKCSNTIEFDKETKSEEANVLHATVKPSFKSNKTKVSPRIILARSRLVQHSKQLVRSFKKKSDIKQSSSVGMTVLTVIIIGLWVLLMIWGITLLSKTTFWGLLVILFALGMIWITVDTLFLNS